MLFRGLVTVCLPVFLSRPSDVPRRPTSPSRDTSPRLHLDCSPASWTCYHFIGRASPVVETDGVHHDMIAFVDRGRGEFSQTGKHEMPARTTVPPRRAHCHFHFPDRAPKARTPLIFRGRSHGVVIVSCENRVGGRRRRCVLTCTYSTIQYRKPQRSRAPDVFLLLPVCLFFFPSPSFPSSVLLLSSRFPIMPALACVGGLCPQISVSRLPRDEASSILEPGLRLG